MKSIVYTRQYSLMLSHLMILLLFITVNNLIFTMAAPMPDTFSAENYDDTIKNFFLHRQAENKRKLVEDELKIQAILEAEERNHYVPSHQQIQPEYSDGELDEILPVPSAVVQNGPVREGKRHYMTLCHFKLCSIGRKRQS